MTHEFRTILKNAALNAEQGLKNVLATVVALDGSSYRKPGVRMLLAEDGSMTGAVSGGCVEKEVLHQAQQVFKSGEPVVMTYDGRYRLGCEGILYILLEPFSISEDLVETINDAFTGRRTFQITSCYRKEECRSAEMGSYVTFEDGTIFSFSGSFQPNKEAGLAFFNQEMKPLFRLVIFGSEHDAVQLCSASSLMGWVVELVASPKDPRTKANFPGAEKVLHLYPEEAESLQLDSQTAVVLMNHNYATDLKFLLSIKDKEPAYIGLLGSVKRREKLFHELIEYYPEISDRLLDKIYGPAGLNIGAISPQEIAVSIISEILTVIRDQQAFPLREKQGSIHI